MTTVLGRIGRGAARHPWRVLVGFVLALMVVGGAAGGLGAGFTDEVRLGDTDSQQASDLLTDRFPAAAGDTATLVFHVDGRLDTAPGGPVGSVVTAVAEQPDVESVTPVQVSADGRTGYTTVLYDAKAADLTWATSSAWSRPWPRWPTRGSRRACGARSSTAGASGRCRSAR